MSDLDPDLAALRDAALQRAQPAMIEIEPEEVRQRVRAGNALCAAGPVVPMLDEVVPLEGRDIAIRTYDAAASPVTLVYAHGGGWVTGDLDYADELCRFVAAAGCRVVSVDYRLAPEHVFPAAHDDVLDVARMLRRRWGAIALAGDSAGGNLAAAAAQRLTAEGSPPLFQVLIYPVLDTDTTRGSYVENATAFPIGAADMRWFLDHYVAGADRAHPRVAPLRATDISQLPPTHALAVGHDPLRDETQVYVQQLQDAGVDATLTMLPTMCHGFLRFTAASPGARAARDALVRRIAELARSADVDAALRG